MRCVDVAALFAAAILRRNPASVVIPFDTRAYQARVEPQDTILSLAERLLGADATRKGDPRLSGRGTPEVASLNSKRRYGGGGTDCSLPLVEANTTYRKRRFAGVILVSDTESWVYRNRAFAYGRRGATGVMTEWQGFVQNQMQLGGHSIPAPKLVCIDLQAYTSTQAPDRADILNIGGFSDAVFKVVAAFLGDDAGRFVTEVEGVEL